MDKVRKKFVGRLSYVFSAWIFGLAFVFALLGNFVSADRHGVHAMWDEAHHAYLPLVYVLPSPAGSYDCLEYEFGLIWTTEVITLNIDGSSVYDYGIYGGLLSGSWAYDPVMQQVDFTGFRWPTATYQFPDVLYTSQYLEDVNFEIALHCDRR